MVDLEVEKTLREIRERVRAEAEAAGADGVARPTARDAEPTPVADHAAGAADAGAGALARLEANLATAERARANLPPLVSNRSGWRARLELWVKRQLKRATHWYTWEQVNYNSAVYHALRDTHASLAALASEIDALSRQLAALEVRLGDEVAAGVETLRGEQRAFVEDIHREQSALADDLRREQGTHAEGLRVGIGEARERAENVLEEQRVLFRQLSLEAGERAVACDRARRDLETRLSEISKAVTSDK